MLPLALLPVAGLSLAGLSLAVLPLAVLSLGTGCGELFDPPADTTVHARPSRVAPQGAEPGSGAAVEELAFEGLDPGLEAQTALGLLGDGESCVSESRAAERVALDILIMLDTSASMLDPLPQEDLAAPVQSKWDAVKASVIAFVGARETRNIGIGLQYFPQLVPDVPFTCSSNLECGPLGGPCSNQVCLVQDSIDFDPSDQDPGLSFLRSTEEPRRPCFDDRDCQQSGARCRTVLGQCVFVPGEDYPTGLIAGFEREDIVFPPLCTVASDCNGVPGTRCESIGLCDGNFATPCSASVACAADLGACADIPATCSRVTRCDAADYVTPAVPIGIGQERSEQVVASIEAQQPNGRTPTGPALAGALQLAREQLAEHPDRQVAVVFATDGLPTQCSPQDIAEVALIAEEGAQGAPEIKTFVIGVFSEPDLVAGAQERLDALARAGGTESAFIVNTGGNVTESFLAALSVIQSTVIGCDFALPAENGLLDFERVNFLLTDEAGEQITLFNVGGPAGCESRDQDGWYYVTGADGTPSQISVCPGVCDAFASGNVSAGLEIGCRTIIK